MERPSLHRAWRLTWLEVRHPLDQAARWLRKCFGASGRCSLVSLFFLSVFVAKGRRLGFYKLNPPELKPPQSDEITYANARSWVAYTGSETCGKCHATIYKEFVQTPMGSSMSGVVQSLQMMNVPVPATVFDPKTNQYIQVFQRESALYMKIYGLSPNGKVTFKHDEKVPFAIGSGVNAVAYIIRRGDYLFQAPMAYYTQSRSWDLAPGYRQNDLGFSRAVTATCVICHSGLPRPVRNNTTGLYHDPPFQELAIGCERCHGPGSLHVEARLRGEPVSGGIDRTIVNPTDLPVWLANDICMSCHQGEDAWVLKNGKNFTDFRPGTPLNDTFAIFAVPPQGESPETLPLLDHYFQMTLSKCFRYSGGRMSCLTCHDPHTWPTPAQAPAYSRQKCLTCHTDQSCALPLKRRLEEKPADNCIASLMPKLEAQHAAHSNVTDHRIIAYKGEPYPSQLPTEGSPGLVYLDTPRGAERAPVDPLVLLQAYSQVIEGGAHAQYRERFLKLLDQLAGSEGNNVIVLRALADRAAAERTSVGDRQAIQYLERVLKAGSTEPGDRLLLGDLLLRQGHASEAVRDASILVASDPYNPLSYVLLASAYMAKGSRDGAAQAISKGLKIYPEDASLQMLMKGITSDRLRLENVH